MVGERGFEPPTPWSRTRKQPFFEIRKNQELEVGSPKPLKKTGNEILALGEHIVVLFWTQPEKKQTDAGSWCLRRVHRILEDTAASRCLNKTRDGYPLDSPGHYRLWFG